MILKQICEYVAPWSTLAGEGQLLCETFFGIVHINSLRWTVWTVLFLFYLSDPIFFFWWLSQPTEAWCKDASLLRGPEQICWVVESFGSSLGEAMFVIQYSQLLWTCACWPHPFPQWVSLSLKSEAKELWGAFFLIPLQIYVIRIWVLAHGLLQFLLSVLYLNN